MPAKGHAGANATKWTAAEKAELKQRLVEVRSEHAWSWKKVCAEVGVSQRTYQDWRQKDEKFALMCSMADGNRVSTLIDESLDMARDPSTPAPQRAWLYMFHIKQGDPTFRDNHKVEHVVSGGLQALVKEFAKIGRSG